LAGAESAAQSRAALHCSFSFNDLVDWRVSNNPRNPLSWRDFFNDVVMLASAQRHRAALWTQDADFDNLPGVKFFAKR